MSRAEARRLIKQGAVKIDGSVITSTFIPVEQFKESCILQVGRKFAKILNSDIKVVVNG
jgi:ribosomal protein S4